MDALIFIYNIFLIIIYTVALTFSVINYRHKKRPLFAVTAVLFAFYIFDNVIIYMTEFIGEFSTFYNLQFINVPAFKTLIFLVESYCLVFIQNLVLPGRRTHRDTAAMVLLGLGLLFAPMAGDGAFMVWLYYLPAQLFSLYLGGSGLLYLKRCPGSLDRECAFYKTLLWVTAVFSLLILAEDTVVIFTFDIYSDIMVKINNRSLSEDIMSIIYSFYAIRYLTGQLQVPQPLPPSAAGDIADMAADAGDGAGSTANTGASSGSTAHAGALAVSAADTAFLHFTSRYQLTSREQDILRILLMDKNNQEISDALFISIGTVKTHVHNIFQKVNVTKRSQLLRVYYEYQKDRPWQ